MRGNERALDGCGHVRKFFCHPHRGVRNIQHHAEVKRLRSDRPPEMRQRGVGVIAAAKRIFALPVQRDDADTGVVQFMHALDIAGNQARVLHREEECRCAVRHLCKVVEGTAEHRALPVCFNLQLEVVENAPKIRVRLLIGARIVAPDCGDLYIFFEAGGFVKGDVQIV